VKKIELVLPLVALIFVKTFGVLAVEAEAKPKVILVPRDYPTIQEAVDAAAPGDIISISSGVYLVNATITVRKSGITIKGAGRSTILKAAPPLDGPIVAVLNAAGVTIANITLDGNKREVTVSNPWIPALLLQSVKNAAIEGVYIFNVSGSGLHLNYPGSPAPGAVIRRVEVADATGVAIVIDGNAQGILIEDVRILGGESRGLLVNTAGGSVKDLTIRRIYVYRSGGAVEEWYGSGTGVHLDGIYGGVGENVVIEDVLVEEPGSFGIWVLGEAWKNVKLVNCTVKNNRDADAFAFADVKDLLLINCTSIGSRIDGFAFGGQGRPPVRNVTVYGCKAVGSGLETGGKGFMFYRVFNSLIAGCEAVETGGAGFYCRGCRNNLFVGIRARRTGLLSKAEGGLTLLSDLEREQAGSTNNTVMYSTFEDNWYGVSIDVYPSAAHSQGNRFVHNNFIGNAISARIDSPAVNIWDDGYPSGGNYWSDHENVDEKQGLNQDAEGGDGISDAPYAINPNNIDRYPLAKPVAPQAIAKAVAASLASIRRPGPLTLQSVNPLELREGEWNTLQLVFVNKGSGEAVNLTVQLEGVETDRSAIRIPALPPGTPKAATFLVKPGSGGVKELIVTVNYSGATGAFYTDSFKARVLVLVKLKVEIVDEDGSRLEIPLKIGCKEEVEFDEWVDPSTSLPLEAPQLVEKENGTRYLFRSWSDGNSSPSRELKLTKSTVLTAIYKTQYLLEVHTPVGEASGGGWYEKNAKAIVTVAQTSVGFGVKRIFSHWEDEAGSIVSKEHTTVITVDKPVKLCAIWRTDYTELAEVAAAVASIAVLLRLLHTRRKVERLQRGSEREHSRRF